MTLLSQPKYKQFEKQAFVKAVGKGMQTLAKRNDFIGGLSAPVVKLFSTGKRTYGRAQQLPSLFRDPKATKSKLLKDKLFARGEKNLVEGQKLSEKSDLSNLFNPKKSLGYRVGRGTGALAIGAPIMYAPFTASKYLGAASADPQLAEDYAKTRAYQRVQDRLEQFSKMPFFERLQTSWDPQSFAKKIETPEANDLYTRMQNNDINNPGILKYLSGFSPFLGGPEDAITNKVRSEVIRSMQGNKEASDLTKQANKFSTFFNKVLKPAYMHGKKFRNPILSNPLKYQAPSSKGFKSYDPFKGKSYLEGLAGSYAARVGKNPIATPLATLMTGMTPLYMYDNYQGGKQQVYNDAAITAEGLADLGIMEQFSRPGFMGGLGRAGMAIAPGIAGDALLNNIRQSLFPTETSEYAPPPDAALERARRSPFGPGLVRR
jgi:hypothetical protein